LLMRRLLSPFYLSPASVKHRLSIAVFRLSSLKDQIQRRLKSEARIKLGRHVPIVWIRPILPVNNFSHSFECFSDLMLAHNPVMEPVCDVLTGYAQGSPIFHPPDIIDVRALW